MIFAGLLAGAGFAPAAAAHVNPLGGAVVQSSSPVASTRFVQVGGDLVQRSQVAIARHEEFGAVRASTTKPSQVASSGFVQMGGDLVQRSQVAMARHEEFGAQHASATTPSPTANSAGFDWRTTIIAISSVAAACLLVAGAYVVRRRVRLTPA
jgi:hypothetical protein